MTMRRQRQNFFCEMTISSLLTALYLRYVSNVCYGFVQLPLSHYKGPFLRINQRTPSVLSKTIRIRELFSGDMHNRANENLEEAEPKNARNNDNEQTRIDPKFLERNKRWLVLVDDEEAIRLAVGDFLYDHGYQVTACADADAVLELLCIKTEGKTEPQLSFPQVPDVLVCDIRMPGIDGIELLGIIRSNERLSRIPVILLTAKGMTQDRIDGYKAGANAYLSKPFNPQELLSIVDNSILRQKQMSGEKANLLQLKQDMVNIKEIMKMNSSKVVKKTDVYLSLAEREVLDLLCEGYTNKEIAKQRGVNIMNVHKMIQKLYTMTKTESRTELLRWAIKTGYVAPR